jgi:hypothetical protein
MCISSWLEGTEELHDIIVIDDKIIMDKIKIRFFILVSDLFFR